MNNIDFHIVLIALIIFVPTIVFVPHHFWVLLPVGVLQFPVLSRWADKRRHGDALGYLVANEAVVFMLAAISVAVLLSK